MDQFYGLNGMEWQLGRQLTDRDCREMRDRWAAVKSDVELTPMPDLPLLSDMGHGGLMALREHAIDKGNRSYNGEFDSAMVKRDEAINHPRERNHDSILADDPLPILQDLVGGIDERAGRNQPGGDPMRKEKLRGLSHRGREEDVCASCILGSLWACHWTEDPTVIMLARS